jgi:uncharacterized protein (TIGR00255 family)
MTGYGRAVETVNGREFTVELRSVNNRYLDCSVRLPRMLSFAEDAVKQAVKGSISRGKVDVFITVRSEAGDEVQVSLNKSVLQSYLAAMHQMVDEFGVKDDISVSAVSRLPEVFVIEKPQVDEDQLMEDALEAGAEDFSSDEDSFEITTEPSDVYAIREALEKLGYKIESAEEDKIPQNYITLEDEDAIKNMNLLLEHLDDDDDVQNVYHNWENCEE